MAELDFERRLERLFAEAPAFADEKAFVAAVERKLDRGWTMRRWLIGAAGLVGGVLGASQLVMSNIMGEVEAASAASAGSARLVQASLAQWAPRLDVLATLPAGSSVVWVAGGLALLALGFVVTRVIEEI